MNASTRLGVVSARAHEEVTAAIAAKAEFRALCVELGLTCDDGTLCKRGAARFLTEHGYFAGKRSDNRESTVRGWVNPYALNRKPPEKALEFLRSKVAAKRRHIDAWANHVAVATAAVQSTR